MKNNDTEKQLNRIRLALPKGEPRQSLKHEKGELRGIQYGTLSFAVHYEEEQRTYHAKLVYTDDILPLATIAKHIDRVLKFQIVSVGRTVDTDELIASCYIRDETDGKYYLHRAPLFDVFSDKEDVEFKKPQ